MPREHPILFSDPMVRAILDGRKTQTRRRVKIGPIVGHGVPDTSAAFAEQQSDGPRFAHPREEYLHVPFSDGTTQRVFCPHGSPGDTLWVREAWRIWDAPEADIQYRADEKIVRYLDSPDSFWRSVRRSSEWRPSIYMPKWASRIRLRVTEVRVERVQEISAEDARAEGIPGPDRGSYEAEWFTPAQRDDRRIQGFRSVWDSINAKRGLGWDANPWVWVVSFERIAS